MTIFTYEDYLEHAKMLSIDLRLSKKMEQSKKKEQKSFKYILNDVGEEYVLQEGENVQHKTGIIIKQKINAKKINNEHDKIFRTVLDKKIDVAKFLNKFLRLGIKAEELEKYNSSYIDQKFRNTCTVFKFIIYFLVIKYFLYILFKRITYFFYFFIV